LVPVKIGAGMFFRKFAISKKFQRTLSVLPNRLCRTSYSETLGARRINQQVKAGKKLKEQVKALSKKN
jgi:hypothetical protein